MIPAAAIGAIAGGAGQAVSLGLAYGINALTPEGQAVDAQNKTDIENLKKNQFGPTRGQQEQQVQDALTMARAQAQAARAESERVGAAQSYRAPVTAAPATAAAANQAGVLRMQAANNAATAAAQARREAFARVKARSDKTIEDIEGIHKSAMEGASAASGGGAVGRSDMTGIAGAYGDGK